MNEPTYPRPSGAMEALGRAWAQTLQQYAPALAEARRTIQRMGEILHHLAPEIERLTHRRRINQARAQRGAR